MEMPTQGIQMMICNLFMCSLQSFNYLKINVLHPMEDFLMVMTFVRMVHKKFVNEFTTIIFMNDEFIYSLTNFINVINNSK
jgi:hypothetical protein